MTTGTVEKIAAAVLYEGYILYPYRPSSIKNQQRFNFGVLYPRAYCDLQQGTDAWEMRTECLVEGCAAATVETKTRFLQLESRGQWQEGREREVCLPGFGLAELETRPERRAFSFGSEGSPETIMGEVELEALGLEQGLWKVSLHVRNLSALPDSDRDPALLHSLVSVHSILHLNDGRFVSLLDPPARFKSAVAQCANSGAWPVLVGEEGERSLMLSAPIILYDYPQIAPESPGDLFDSCEIDEILALRILTMTDAEKLEVRNGDDRAKQILERTEMMPPEHFQRLHGALRGMRVVPEDTQ